jgi:hypothetical protein
MKARQVLSDYLIAQFKVRGTAASPAERAELVRRAILELERPDLPKSVAKERKSPKQRVR